ncbi:uncharacterized protein LOC108632275 [Ceratina calcarata]|uniref:Uncharacterized protein LOC108632275 n=1 Tax=Ceratina calcarata TaxID=156304 RepID=A0AAJ7WGE0_9HYME|nr:uncharacterized protein LOC108632275 [Ceratina calcarata]
MSKWNESLVVCFLNEYRQYPCLWNPYHKDYYNCREKNEALRRIIEHLGVPGYTVNDYLKQIKMIREKYKQEQTRMIKCLRSQKQYKSPLSWYDTVADMLTKVIKDEEEAQQRDARYGLRSLSSDNLKDSLKRPERTETDARPLRVHPCSNATCDSARRCKSVEKPSCLVRKRNSTEKIFKDKADKKVTYVPCPQYISQDREDPISSREPTRDTGPGSLGVPSTSMNSESPFLQCPSCGWEDAKHEKSYIPCSDYNKNLSGAFYNACTGCDQVTRDDLSERARKRMDHSGDFDILKNVSKPTIETETAKKQVDAGVQYSEEPKDDDSKIRTQVIQVDPAVASNLRCGTIEACTRFKIIISDPCKEMKSSTFATESVYQKTESVQCVNRIETSTKETECPPEKVICECDACETGMNTASPEVRNTICVSDEAARCVMVQAVEEVEHEEKETEKYCETASKEVAVNIADKVSKAVQSTICVSRGSSACYVPSPARESAEIGTAMSVHRIRSIGCMTEKPKEFRSHFVQCKDRYLSLTRSKSFSSVKRCVRDTKHSADKETQGFADACTTDTCSLNILNLTREDPAVAVAVEQLLKKLILFKREHATQRLTDHEYDRVKRDCMIDATGMVNTIKEYARMLEPSATKDDWTQIQWLEEIERKRSSTDVDTSTVDSKLTMTDETMTEPVFQSTVAAQDEERRFQMIDKEVITRGTYKDVGSLTRSPLRDAEIQSSASRLKDTAVEDSREKVNVGTQKRDPILVRVIKCSDTQAVTRTDKTTTMGTDVDPGKRYVKACGRSTCVPLKVCRRSKDMKSPYCGMEREIADARHKRTVAFNEDICDRNCKTKLSYDWTDVSNVDVLSDVNSKIPTCRRTCKYNYSYARSN